MTTIRLSDKEIELLSVALIHTLQSCDELGLERSVDQIEKLLDKLIESMTQASKDRIRALLQAVVDFAEHLN